MSTVKTRERPERKAGGKQPVSREPALLVPVPDGWQSWHATGDAGLRAGKTHARADEAAIGPGTILALPTRQTVVLPLWLSTTDERLLDDLTRAQLERRGLLPKNELGQPFDRWIVAREGERTLVAAAVLPAAPPEDLCPPQARRFDLLARTRALPHDSLVLWPEADGLTLAVTRGDQLVLTQHLGDARPTPELATEILCIGLSLYGDGICDPPVGLFLHGDFAAEEIALLQQTLGVPVTALPSQAPRVPAHPLRLLPAPVARAQEDRRRARRNARLLALCALLYVVAMAGFVSRTALLYYRNERVAAELALHATDVERVKDAAAHWDAVRAAVDPDVYPIELLHRTNTALPPSGVRLLTFDTREGKLILTGEASNPQLPASLYKNLRENKDLVAYRWTAPQQSRMPSGSWRFTLEGASPDANQ